MFLKISRDVFQFGHNPKSSAPRIIIEILEELQITLDFFWNSSGNLTKIFLQTMTKLLIPFLCLFLYVLKCCTNSCMLNRHVSLLGTQITSSSKHIIPWNSTLFNPCASVDQAICSVFVTNYCHTPTSKVFPLLYPQTIRDFQSV